MLRRIVHFIALRLLLVFLCLPVSVQGQTQAPPEPDAPQASESVKKQLVEVNSLLQAGKLQEALHVVEQTLDLARKSQDAPGEARALREKARVLQSLDRVAEAIETWKLAGIVWQTLANGPQQIESLLQEATLQIFSDPVGSQKLVEQALSCTHAETKRLLATATVLNDAGVRFYNGGVLEAARALWETALQIIKLKAPGSLDVANSLSNLGTVVWLRGDQSAAEEYFKQALEIRKLKAPASLDVAASLFSLGTVASARGHLPQALQYAQDAWALVRSHASHVSGDKTRQAFEQKYQLYAANLINIQLALKQVEFAFVTLEEGRAQALQQLLLERRLYARTATGAEWETYQQSVVVQQRAQKTLEQFSIQQTLTQRQVALAKQENAPPAQMQRLEQQETDLKQEVETASTTLLRASVEMESRWRGFVQANPRVFPEPLSAAQARKILPVGTLLLAFSVADEQTSLFLVQADKPLLSFSIPISRNELQKQVQELRSSVTTARSGADEVAQVGRKLFTTFFPPGAQQAIQSAARLLVAPDDLLWEVPFAALVSSPAGKQPTWLGLEKPLCYTPSLTQWVQARQQPLALGTGHKPVAVVVGDCLFDRRQVAQKEISSPAQMANRQMKASAPVGNAVAKSSSSTAVAMAQKPEGKKSSPSLVAVAEKPTVRAGERHYLWGSDTPPAPLPHTRDEAVQVARLYGTTPLLGEQATEAELRKRIREADILHLATHGYFPPQGKLAMSAGVLLSVPEVEPSSTDTNNDGALQAWEIFSQLKMRAELVVLSACESGEGRNVAGEGVIGLTRALQVAGCRSIIASQWSVNDASTAALMTTLHQNLRNGKSKDGALLAAMQAVARQKGSSHPYYWAPFFLVGDPDNPNLAR